MRMVGGVRRGDGDDDVIDEKHSYGVGWRMMHRWMDGCGWIASTGFEGMTLWGLWRRQHLGNSVSQR